MVRAAALILAIALGIPQPSLSLGGINSTLRVFLDTCENPPDTNTSAFCLGYVAGIADASEIAHAGTGGTRLWCRPEGATIRQINDTVLAFGRARPQDHHENSTAMIILILREAFPCPRQ